MESNTIFDDVFRTMVEKMPELVIPLINEAFGTKYPLNTRYDQMRNEHQLPNGEIITDSCIRIGNCFYHIECQSSDDKTMAIRMVEYDFHIALEHAERDGHRYVMKFPKSCVLYIRYGKNIPDYLEVDVIFPDRSTHTYRIPTLKITDYGREEILNKNLLFFLPYYILRYENALNRIEKSPKRVKELSEEYQMIERELQNILGEDRADQMSRLMELIKTVADYVLRNHEPVRKELDTVMGGKVLELQCDKAMDKAFADGQAQEKITMAQTMLQAHEELAKICAYTKLSEAEVKELESKLKKDSSKSQAV